MPPHRGHISSLSQVTLLKGNSVDHSHHESCVEVPGIEPEFFWTAGHCSTTELTSYHPNYVIRLEFKQEPSEY